MHLGLDSSLTGDFLFLVKDSLSRWVLASLVNCCKEGGGTGAEACCMIVLCQFCFWLVLSYHDISHWSLSRWYVYLLIAKRHSPFGRRGPLITMQCWFFAISISCFENMAIHLSSHNCPMEINVAVIAFGKWCACLAFVESDTSRFSSWPECVTLRVWPLAICTFGPLLVVNRTFEQRWLCWEVGRKWTGFLNKGDNVGR
jgi:hypothetical protein